MLGGQVGLQGVHMTAVFCSNGSMKYELIGIDVDGTLLGPDHKLDAATIAAIGDARAAGLKVCLATGRSFNETINVWSELNLSGPFEPMVLIGGALVSEPDTGRTLYHKTIPAGLACEFADALGRAGYSAMAIVDEWRHGWDYILCETGNVHAAQRDWFAKMDVEIRHVKRLSDADHLPSPLRINAVADAAEAQELAAQMAAKFAGRLNVHAIVAPNYDVTIVEGFALDADKFTALRYIAQAYRIAPGQIAAVGDDVNDLSMIRGAGLGVAMPNASGDVLDACDVVAEGGLAEFLPRLTASEFD